MIENALQQEKTLIRKEEVAKLLDTTTATLDRMWKAGRFPRPFRLGHQLRWRHVDVEAWIDAQVSAAQSMIAHP